MSQIIRRMATEMHRIPPLVSTHFLNEQMKTHSFEKKYRIIDASWDLPSAGRNTQKEHFEKRIPQSKFFGIDDCCDKQTSLPHMLPGGKDFEKYVSSLGISNEHHVVVYDNSSKFGLFSAPRVWWTLRVFGHDMVSVLDGGLPKWISDGYPTESGEYESGKNDETANFIAKYRPDLVKDIGFIKDTLKGDPKSQVIDARPTGRFQGISPEPRADISSGHIPNSYNVSFMDCLKENRELKSREELLQLFESKGIDVSKNLVATCGSGVSACIFALSVFESCGKEIPVYDGSWVEWATKEPSNIIKC